MISDQDLLTLNCYEEARGELDDGVAAVAQVVLNRMQHKGPQSDGTIPGTILYPNAFSWTQWEMVEDSHGEWRYTKVAHTQQETLIRVQHRLNAAKLHVADWTRCARIAGEVVKGEYHTQAFDALGPDAVSYYNPHIHGQATPKWATPAKRVCAIGHHDFFRA